MAAGPNNSDNPVTQSGESPDRRPRKTGNAKWRETYRRRLREEHGLIQVNVTVPEGAAPLIKELARRLKDGTWPEFALKPWDAASRRTLAAFRGRHQVQRQASAADKASSPREPALGDAHDPPAEAPRRPVTVRFAHAPSADDVALLESPPYQLGRAESDSWSWRGNLPDLLIRRLRIEVTHKLRASRPVVTEHKAEAGGSPGTTGGTP